MANRYGRVAWGAGEDRSRTSEANWRAPLKWDRAAAAAGKPATVFCLSLGDIWDNEVDERWRHDAFALMERTPHLIWLLLSKRIGNAEKMCDPRAGHRTLPRNAALGATMIDQPEWDRDLPKLKHAGQVLGARFTFSSVEPMLGEIDARGDLPDWVIVGGESGRNARPMHPDWARSLRDQCAVAGIPFHFKQWGEWKQGSDFKPNAKAVLRDGRIVDPTPMALALADREGGYANSGEMMRRVGKHAAGRLLDGVTHDAFPVTA